MTDTVSRTHSTRRVTKATVINEAVYQNDETTKQYTHTQTYNRQTDKESERV